MPAYSGIHLFCVTNSQFTWITTAILADQLVHVPTLPKYYILYHRMSDPYPSRNGTPPFSACFFL